MNSLSHVFEVEAIYNIPLSAPMGERLMTSDQVMEDAMQDLETAINEAEGIERMVGNAGGSLEVGTPLLLLIFPDRQAEKSYENPAILPCGG